MTTNFTQFSPYYLNSIETPIQCLISTHTSSNTSNQWIIATNSQYTFHLSFLLGVLLSPSMAGRNALCDLIWVNANFIMELTLCSLTCIAAGKHGE